MEPIIGFKKSNCKNCYKCIRKCPVKSISFREEQARIVDDDCIYCGQCLLNCPQNAKYIDSDLPKIKAAIKAGDKLYVSLAPSYIAAFPDAGILEISYALKKLGFSHVEETAIGAEQVTRGYEALIREHRMKNIITTSCPSVNLLVEKYYPSLIGQLAPVVTPAVAHARMIKQVYGVRAKVVFVGPCISKKFECRDPDNNNAIFAVLTFDELADWFAAESVSYTQRDADGRTLINTMPRYYPAPGGIIKNLHREERLAYECLSVDGIPRCIEMLDSIMQDNLTGYFLELNACSGACLGGPVLRLMHAGFLKSRNALIKNVRRTNEAPSALTEGVTAQFTKKFRNRSAKNSKVSEEDIRRVLGSIGKTSPEKELNCGSCGYNTCREKAIAVLQGKADMRMCLPYMRELAESMSNTVVENTPTGILIINDKLEVVQFNPSAARLLGISDDVLGKPVTNILPSGDFYEALTNGGKIANHHQYYEKLGLTLEQTVVNVKSSDLSFVLLTDVTKEEQMNENHRLVTEKTAAFAQEVVDKQMRVVQEIADLLGEATTETKIALSQLTKSLVPEKENSHGPTN